MKEDKIPNSGLCLLAIGFLIRLVLSRARNEPEIQTIFSCYIDLKNKPQDRSWCDFELDFVIYNEREVAIFFIVKPGLNNGFDWVYWGKPVILAKRIEEGT